MGSVRTDLLDVVDRRRPLESLAAIAFGAREQLDRSGALPSLRDRGAPADVLVTTACALAVAEANRALGVELHDVQIMAGAALCAGWTVQMRTGEGKTFAAIPAALLHATVSGPVHVATANSYLAERDASWSGAVLEALGLTVGASLPTVDRAAKRAAYAADVTFASCLDLGFDYLRDRLHLAGDQAVQPERCVAIVDEADAVLIDNGRTPLVLSGVVPGRTAALERVEQVVRTLRLGVDVELDEAHRRIELTEAGIERCEDAFGVESLFSPGDIDWPSLIDNALRARALLVRDRDYVVVDGRVEVIDELTGRIVDGRRWSDGLHQAVEAKESVAVSPERVPVAQITQAGYFAGYDLLVGMSGTLERAEDELAAVHGLRTIVIPTHRPVVRLDHPDAAFTSNDEKMTAVAGDIAERQRRRQPVLVGTRSIAATRAFSRVLGEMGVEHETLTAQDHRREAVIIAEAGRPGAVTVATQMAGRGVDIVLGGVRAPASDRRQVVDAGGLMVWGLEHHPSHRLDMQLRGRAGRQGDPGESRFAVTPEDDLVALGSGDDDLAARLARGQLRAEVMESQLRWQVLLYDKAIDSLQRHLYRWRQQAADRRDMHLLRAAAVEASAVWLARGGHLPDVDTTSLPRWGHRRRAGGRAAIERRLRERSLSVGPATFESAGELILRTLLVVLWPAALEQLEARKSLARIAPAFGMGARRQWEAAAVDVYRRFESTTRVEWVRQLLGFQVAPPGAGPPAPAPVEPVALPVPEDGLGAAESTLPEQELELIDWQGWSYNRFVREHFVPARPEPPVVLVIDAVGDLPTHGGLALDLDLDVPERTVVYPEGT